MTIPLERGMCRSLCQTERRSVSALTTPSRPARKRSSRGNSAPSGYGQSISQWLCVVIDPPANLTAINVSDVRELVNGYDLKENQVKATDPRGNSSTFTY